MTEHTDIWHTLIIGGGAGGLFCAGSFAAPKLLLEHNRRPGEKLSITGGGKCNFGHRSVTAGDYLCSHKHFCKNALAAFGPQAFAQLLKQAKIPFDELPSGQFFARSSPEITRFLTQRARQQNTTISCQTQVLGLTREKDLFCVRTSRGNFYARQVVVAAGGLSYPALGATGLSFQLAQALGLSVTPLRPALVGLSVPQPLRAACKALAGNSCPVEVSVGKHTERGQLLFTHEGVSGPAVLQSSLFWNEGEKVQINFLPQLSWAQFLAQHKNEPTSFSKLLSPHLSAKIIKTLLGPLDVRAADASKDVLRRVEQTLQAWQFVPTGTAGYTRAEVTAGGVDVTQINPHTLECKTLPGLFFIGEALDVTGRVGGYNLHWAWASAFCAAQELAKR